MTTHSNRSIPIPKTYTTRKGPLLLFSEDFVGKVELVNNEFNIDYDKRITNESIMSYASTTATSVKDKLSLKTMNDLRTSILTFGAPEIEPLDESKHDIDSSYHLTTTTPAVTAESIANLKRESTQAYLKFFKTNHNDKRMFNKIRPGFSAKRYLASWSKYWRPELFETLFREGKLKEETLFESSEILPNIKHRIDDNLSKIPPAYRIQHQWLATTIQPLRGYRFYRANTDFLGICKLI